jgi:DNA-binding response OmpR family regulator
VSARILLVDDDTNILETAKDILEDAGFEITTAVSVATALECLRTTPIGVIITDLNLPDGTGLDLAEKARSLGNRVPILLMTGQAEGAEPAGLAARQNGIVDDYLVKPVNPPQLINVLRRILR